MLNLGRYSGRLSRDTSLKTHEEVEKQRLLEYEQINWAIHKLEVVKLLTSKIREVILDKPEHAMGVAMAFSNLSEVWLLTERTRKVILDKPEYAFGIYMLLILLDKAELLTSKIREVILDKPEHAMSVAVSFGILNDAGMLTLENLETFIPVYMEHPTRLRGVIEAFCILDGVNLLTPRNRKVILDNSENAWRIYIKFALLNAKKELIAEKIAEAVKEAMCPCLSDLNNDNSPSMHSQFFLPVAHTQQAQSNQQESLLGQNTDSTAYNNVNRVVLQR